MPALAQILSCLDRRYDPRWAEEWDAVGLVCGDPASDIRRVLLAVDPVEAVVDEALDSGADLLISHHPLFLRPVHSVAASSGKGALVHRLIRGGCALHVIHTNADSASPGVSDALAAALGVQGLAPLAAQPAAELDVLVTFVPEADAESLIDALAGAGAGRLGAYDRCAWTTGGTGTFRPGQAARPAIGRIGEIERVPETRVEMALPRAHRQAVVAALRSAHPYEEPAFDVLEMAPWPGPRGLGRVGTLAQPVTMAEFTAVAAEALPGTTSGVRASGDPNRLVSRVAVCGGAGDSLVTAARSAGADVFVTADLRHHVTSEANLAALDGMSGHSMAMLDVSHWASEWPWLRECAHHLTVDLADLLGRDAPTVTTQVSTTCTDPWTLHMRSGAADEGSKS